MTVIWLVEMVESSEESAYRVLANDFAVRRIASIASLRSIYAMEDEDRRPQLIICREPRCDDRLKILASVHVLKRLLAYCTVALSSDSSPTWQEIAAHQDIPRIGLNLENGFSLKSQIDLLLSLKGRETKGEQSSPESISIGDIEFHSRKSMIKIQGATSENLLPKEARIFEVLVKSPNSCVSRAILAELVWPGVRISDRTLDSHVSRLRRKLDASFECEIESIYGEGYCLRVGDSRG